MANFQPNNKLRSEATSLPSKGWIEAVRPFFPKNLRGVNLKTSKQTLGAFNNEMSSRT